MDQLLQINTEGIQQDGKDTFHNHRYEPTPYEWLTKLYNLFPINSSDTLVDFGCGKGRLNFFVHYKFGCHTVGVEFNPKYYEDACNNLSSYVKRNNANIEFQLKKAQDYQVQPCDTIFYFFNPFSPQIFMSVMNHISQSIEDHPRIAYLILYYPDSEYVDYINDHTCFKLVDQIHVNCDSKDTRECFLIFLHEG